MISGLALLFFLHLNKMVNICMKTNRKPLIFNIFNKCAVFNKVTYIIQMDLQSNILYIIYKLFKKTKQRLIDNCLLKRSTENISLNAHP